LNDQLDYLTANEEQIKDILSKSYTESYDKMLKDQQLRRVKLQQSQEERKEQQIFDYDAKRKELEWLLQLYHDEGELEKVNRQLKELEIEFDQWFYRFENECADDERRLDEREQDEENRLLGNFMNQTSFIRKIFINFYIFQ
jgi:hypothetical protein